MSLMKDPGRSPEMDVNGDGGSKAARVRVCGSNTISDLRGTRYEIIVDVSVSVYYIYMV